jgi:hypothetical protein
VYDGSINILWLLYNLINSFFFDTCLKKLILEVFLKLCDPPTIESL